MRLDHQHTTWSGPNRQFRPAAPAAHCGPPQDDLYLHSEPDQPFFDIPHAAPGSIKLTPLTGTIQLNGNEHFTVE
jgi:hypothetical protein